jgi:hypothetical protein
MDDLREVIARAVQEAVEAMPYGNGFNTEEDVGEGEWRERPTTLRGFFDDTWQSSHGDELFANASSAATDAALAAIKQAGSVVVPAHASPKMAEAGLFANENALLMSAGAGDMMNAYRAMIEASNAPT